MKIYFPNDPIKQEMLEALKNCYEQIDNFLHSEYNSSVDYAMPEIKEIIERATGTSIDEVMK